MSSLSSSIFSIPKQTQSSSLTTKSKFIWRFPPSKFVNLPSCSSKQFSSNDLLKILNFDEELLLRQQLSILIYDLGSQINVSFTCIYTGVVYMQRYFMLHSFQQCQKEFVAAACLFLSCKVNEMTRPLNDFTRHLFQIINQNNSNHLNSSLTNLTAEIYLYYNQQIIDYENILLSTLGFCFNVEQPYSTLTKISQTLLIPIEITQKANEIATKSIFLTHFSLKYTTNLIACFALYLATKSSQIHIPDNPDGSQWFHLLNEEFTEKILTELADEYESICINKCPKQIHQRYEQLRYEKKLVCQQINQKINGEQLTNTVLTNNTIDQIEKVNGLIGNSASICDQTPIRSSLVSIPQIDYSPITIKTSPKSNSNHFNGKYHENTNPISKITAKPIPTLMTSSNGNSCPNSFAFPPYSRFSVPTFKPAALSPSQHIYRPVIPSNTVTAPYPIPAYPCQYPPNYGLNSSYYPQQQTPLFYHSHADLANLNNKRYGEPPGAPAKRFRYNLNAYQHY